MKGVCLGRKFYRKMFGLVLLIPVVLYIAMYTASLALSVFRIVFGALLVGIVLYLAWRGWIEKRPSD